MPAVVMLEGDMLQVQWGGFRYQGLGDIHEGVGRLGSGMFSERRMSLSASLPIEMKQTNTQCG